MSLKALEKKRKKKERGTEGGRWRMFISYFDRLKVFVNLRQREEKKTKYRLLMKVSR